MSSQKKILDLADWVFTETVFLLQPCRNRNIKYQRDLFFIATWSHLFNSKWVSTTKLGRMVEQHTLTFQVMITWPQLCHVTNINKPYNNRNRQNSKTSCTERILQVMIISLSLGLLINIYDFFSFALNSITTKLGRDDKLACIGAKLQVKMTFPPLAYMVTFYVSW